MANIKPKTSSVNSKDSFLLSDGRADQRRQARINGLKATTGKDGLELGNDAKQALQKGPSKATKPTV